MNTIAIRITSTETNPENIYGPPESRVWPIERAMKLLRSDDRDGNHKDLSDKKLKAALERGVTFYTEKHRFKKCGSMGS